MNTQVNYVKYYKFLNNELEYIMIISKNSGNTGVSFTDELLQT